MSLRVFCPIRKGPYPATEGPVHKRVARPTNKHDLCTAGQLRHTEETVWLLRKGMHVPEATNRKTVMDTRRRTNKNTQIVSFPILNFKPRDAVSCLPWQTL